MPHLHPHPQSRPPRRAPVVPVAAAALVAAGLTSPQCTSAATAGAGLVAAASSVRHHGRGLDARRAVLRPAFPTTSRPTPGRGQLRRGGQQRRHHPLRRRAGRLRRHRCPCQPQLTWPAPARRRRSGPGRPRRRGCRLQPAATNGSGPAAADRPGPRPDLPRPDHLAGTTRPSPPSTPAPTCPTPHHRRAPLRRQRHHLHFQQLSVHRQPAWAAEAGTGRSLHWPTGTAPTGTPASPPRSPASPTPSATSNAPTPTGPPGPAAIQNQAGNYVYPHHRRPSPPTPPPGPHHPGQLLHRQRARPRPATPSADTAGSPSRSASPARPPARP